MTADFQSNECSMAAPGAMRQGSRQGSQQGSRQSGEAGHVDVAAPPIFYALS
jgi:hypothetical protein